jgi:hypothetical protein
MSKRQHGVSVRVDDASQLLGRSYVGVVALAVEHHVIGTRNRMRHRADNLL